jgi:hypothetical protein
MAYHVSRHGMPRFGPASEFGVLSLSFPFLVCHHRRFFCCSLCLYFSFRIDPVGGRTDGWQFAFLALGGLDTTF